MANVQRGARAGIAALALGLSLASPVIAVASADGTDNSSASSSGNSATSSSGSAKKTTGHTARGPKATTSSSAAADDTNGKSTTTSKKTVAAETASSTGSSTRPEARSRRTSSNSTTTSSSTSTTDSTAADATGTTTASATESTTSTPVAASSTAQMTAGSTTGNRTASANADPITALVNAIQGYFAGASLLVRRTFFNEAPSVSVVQLTGQTTGPIAGQVDAVDPEGDHLVYKLTQEAHYGTVVLNQDGSYTYTPEPGGQCSSTCIDSFTVSATDTGLHINLLNWFREGATSAAGAIYQQPANTPRITFTFSYGSGSQFWSSAARADLQSSAIILSSYFVPSQDVNLTYKVTGQYSLMGGTLASAGSDLVSDGTGFYDTVVQNKILTGVDSNATAPDGTITWNFGYGWGYGDVVPGGSYDFQSTAMHELMHTFGFISVVDSAGNNTVPNWTTFDSFIVNKNGTSVFNGTTFNTAYNSNLTGGDTGLYFGGANAVLAYGGPVPLYTPSPWESGSSMSHLDDNTFTGVLEKLMNATSGTGKGVRILSPVEIAIMHDLGYTMVSQSAGGAVLFIGMMLVGRRRRR
ncbi:conserved exported hypothetical protein [uncultured Mycobacterium sp.]|uniref:Uncharacterized protein n=1 Tax=uncultured Mycobacterium sp. TaxID=171292 RepID=A0A1Y5PF08_9MYCO|nr:conserved exported hypothetical protein [uncultured Mycobacterium sp.]